MEYHVANVHLYDSDGYEKKRKRKRKRKKKKEKRKKKEIKLNEMSRLPHRCHCQSI